MATYYSNHPSLSLATALYMDAAFVTKAPDAWYSDGTINRRQVSGVLQDAVTCDSCTPNPATSTLTFEAYDSGTGAASRFYFFLSEALALNDLTISGASIDAYEQANCNQSNPTATDSMFENAIIYANTNNANVRGNGIPCSTPVSLYKKINGFQVNGTQVSNGQTIVVNGCTITVVINTDCSDLSCNS